MSNNVEVKDLRWASLQFTDLAGFFRQVIVRVRPGSRSLEELVSKLDGSSVKGFTGIEESDLLLKPDIKTFAKLPWSDGVGRLICRVYLNSERFVRDPRYVAEKLDDLLTSTNIKPFVSAELEFFVFDKVTVGVSPQKQFFEISSTEASWEDLPFVNRVKEGYYVTYPKDKFIDFKTELAETLINYFGLAVEALHHEVAAASQHEISFEGGSLTYVYARSVMEMDYVTLARLSGLSPVKIMSRHVMRNVLTPVLVQAVTDMGSVLLEASTINFLGLGLPLNSPEWGVILLEGLGVLEIAPWISAYPGLFLLITALGFSLVGDTLREEMDPRLRRRWRLWF
jgi:hypothetical protein